MGGQLIFFFILYIADLIYLYNVGNMFAFFIGNTVTQMVWFNIVAIIPNILTHEMKWVDIAWPWGVFLLGAQGLFSSSSASPRRFIITAIYIVIGLRMGIGAALMIPKMRKDFPRYEYAKMKFKKKDPNSVQFQMIVDIYLQAIANVIVLFWPLATLAYNESPITRMEQFCYISFIGFFVFESVADGQKIEFIRTCENKRKDVCRYGLWQYSRHPNYFGQWMQWNCIALASVSCLLSDGSDITSIAITVFHALFLSYSFYICLVYWTGAKPAEYYSVQKRPDYKRYQREVNMFVPWFPKKSSTEL